MRGRCSNEDKVVEDILEYFSGLFTSLDSYSSEDKLNGILSTITNYINSNLIKPVKNSEIKRLYSL